MNLSRMREKWFLVEHKGKAKGEPGAVLVEKCESLTAPQPRKFPPMPLWKNPLERPGAVTVDAGLMDW